MSVCTFFGHRECPSSVRPLVENAVRRLITEDGVDLFYVGNHGRFDAIVRRVLSGLKAEFPHIEYAVVLAYVPGRQFPCEDSSDTMLPEGMEDVHPRYAITRRNRWMLARADYVVTYITHTPSRAEQFAEQARRMGKKIIPLG